ncbi:MAG: DUF6883 domain-containing protein [Anaerolineae bacterium]
MRLPNRTKAYVPRAKLTQYLLSEAHTVGKSKAKFFRACGFDETTVDRLEQSLLAIARTGAVVKTVPSPYGDKYVVDGDLALPSCSSVIVRTVWIIETGETRPRFVTAYPI